MDNSTSSDSTSLALVSSGTVSASTALEVSVLLGLNPDDIAGRTFNDIVDTVLLLGETQDDLVGVLHSHGAVDVNAVGIHWHITDRNSDTSVPRYSRASFVHYPPTGVREHVNAAGDGTCSTFRVVARAVNDARMAVGQSPSMAVGQSRVPFADMWDGLFDLMPVPFDIGYNFGSDYYNDLVPTFREEYDQAQTRVVTAFFLSEIRKGQIGCRGLVTGAVPMDRWPTYIERATRAANLIAMSLGYDHYDVTIPTFADTDTNGITLVTPYSFTTPERRFNEFPTLDVNIIPCLAVIKNCHPAAFFYNLSLQMGSRFDAALSYVLEDILDGATVRLYTRAAQNNERRLSDAAAMIADYDGEMWLTIGGPSSNMSEDYHRAVREGRTIFGRMGYEGVIKRLMEIWDCTFEQAKRIFGQMGYEGRVAIVMRDRGLSEEGARSYIGEHAYEGRVNNVMREHDLSEEDARRHIGNMSYAATILAIMGFFVCNEETAKFMFAKQGSKAAADQRRIADNRKECETKGCDRLQSTQTNPLCQQCTGKEAKKRKSEEIENKVKRCIMPLCGRTDDEYAFKTKEYCKMCYKTEAGKKHRADRKREMFVLCSEPGCDNKAWKAGKCESCYKGRH